MTLIEAILDFEKEFPDYPWSIVSGSHIGHGMILVCVSAPGYELDSIYTPCHSSLIPSGFLQLKRYLSGERVHNVVDLRGLE